MDISIFYPNHILIALVLTFIFGVIVTFKPAIGFYSVCLFLPVYLLRIRGTAIPTNGLELLLVMTVLGWLGYSLGHKKEIYLPDKYFLAGAGLIILGAFISLAVSKNEFFLQGAGVFKGFIIEPIIFSMVLYSAIRQKVVNKERIIKFLVWSSSIVAIFSLIGALIPSLDFWTYDYRLRGFYLSPNHLAMYLAPLLPFVGYLVYKTKQKERALYFALGATVLIVLFLTKSLGAWLGLFIAAIITGVIWRKSLTQKAKKTIIPGGAFLSLMFSFIFREEVISFLLNPERSSWASRFQIWNSALAILRDNPLLGIGLGTFQEYYLAYQQYFPQYLEWAVPQPHNVLLAAWLQTGILGLIGFLWLIARFFSKSIKRINLEVSLPSEQNRNKYKTAAVTAAVVIILVHGLVDTTIWKNDLAVVFWLLLLCFIDSPKNKS